MRIFRIRPDTYTDQENPWTILLPCEPFGHGSLLYAATVCSQIWKKECAAIPDSVEMV